MEQKAATGSAGKAAAASLPRAGSGDLSRKALGQFGEDLAARHLCGLGYQIVARNWQCREGEVDLVALDADCLVFVEVKTRSSWAFGGPSEAVGRIKLARLRRLALHYLQKFQPHADTVRIDVIAITTGGGQRRLEHFKGVDQ